MIWGLVVKGQAGGGGLETQTEDRFEDQDAACVQSIAESRARQAGLGLGPPSHQHESSFGAGFGRSISRSRWRHVCSQLLD